MGWYFERLLALRYLRSKRKEVFVSIITVISILGVAVSVMVLDMVLSIMTGFEIELRTKLVDANAHILIRSALGEMSEYQKVVDAVNRIDGVVEAYPYTYNQAMLASDSGSRGILIRGVGKERIPRAKLEKTLDDKGVLARLDSPPAITVVRPDGEEDEVVLPPIVLGRNVVDRFGLSVLSPVTLFAPQFNASPQGLIPKLRRFVVVGTYSSGLMEYENGLAYTSIDAAQAFFGLGSLVTGVEVTVRDLFHAKEVALRIQEALSTTPGQFVVSDWTDQNKPLWDALKLEKNVYFIVLLLLILVASFSVVSTLVMTVMEKSRDIAVLKAMGASGHSILAVFLMQGALIGLIGILLGTFLGAVGCLLLREYGFPIDPRVFSLDQVPVHIDPGNFVLVAISAFCITAVAGIYPALRASKLRPADALRFE